MIDVLVAGAGPAGSVAALLLARAGARVVMVDRDEFPRDKLCGDTLNPGAVAMLASIGMTGGPLDTARPIFGMRVTGPAATVTGAYGDGVHGLSIRRRDLDAWLLEAAVAAGARFEPRLIVRGPLCDSGAGETRVRGLVLGRRGHPGDVRMPASMVIAADGRRSVLAAALKLRRDPPTVRRWAFGVYATGVAGMTDFGELHVRDGWYLGLASVAHVTNVCVVTPKPTGRTPLDVIRGVVARDPMLASRLADATFDDDVRVLGPVAADPRGSGVPGLLLAGDAAGFIDPMTGDGLHLAMQGAKLAATETMRVLEDGDAAAAVGRLADARRRQFGRKLTFNRVVRRVVASASAIQAASLIAHVAPGSIRSAVRYAGDVA